MYPQRSVMTCGLATALEPPHFNHAPVRGATGASFSRRSRAGSFNPRTRVGCDRSKSWGVPRRSCFNPRTRVGCDSANREFPARARLFQSTHPRGVRRYGHGRRRSVAGFNPRTRVGCDVYRDAAKRGEDMFQSTHPRGVRRRISSPIPSRFPVSIHAPAWGATTAWEGMVQDGDVSIHAPAWGATPEGDTSRKAV